jgi:hypothetical protein
MHINDAIAELNILRRDMVQARLILIGYRSFARAAKASGHMRQWAYYMNQCKIEKRRLSETAGIIHRALFIMGKTKVRPI